MSHDPYSPPKSPYDPPSGTSEAPGGGLPLGLGIFGMIAWILPIVGFPINLWGLIRGIRAIPGRDHTMAIIAVVLCSIGLALSILNAAVGVYLALNGQNALVNQMKGQ